MGRLGLGEVFLLPVTPARIRNDLRAEVACDIYRSVGRPRVDDQSLLGESPDAFDRASDIIFFVERDDRHAQGGPRHSKKIAYKSVA